jgi:hypothetical protein
VSTRDPVARMRSAFINKFLIHKFVVLQQLNQLELFSKDFLRCAKRISFASPAKTIRMSRSRNTFRISLSSFIETVSSEAHTRLIDGHFKPQLLEVNHLDAITSLSSQVRVLPLRTERLKEDLSALNNVMGFNYMPGKDNVSDMPAGWELSDSEDSVKMSNQELISQKIVPSLKALNRWLSVNPQVQKSFMNRFDWDYKLISFLQGLDDV